MTKFKITLGLRDECVNVFPIYLHPYNWISENNEK